MFKNTLEKDVDLTSLFETCTLWYVHQIVFIKLNKYIVPGVYGSTQIRNGIEYHMHMAITVFKWISWTLDLHSRSRTIWILYT